MITTYKTRAEALAALKPNEPESERLILIDNTWAIERAGPPPKTRIQAALDAEKAVAP